MLERGLDPSGRDVIYKEGIKQFLRFPVFGGSFFPVDFSPYCFSSVAEFAYFFSIYTELNKAFTKSTAYRFCIGVQRTAEG